MLILQVDGNIVICTLQNHYYHAQFLLLCMLYANLIGEQNANINFPQWYGKRVHCSVNLNERIDSIYESYEKIAGLFGLLTRDTVFRCTV